MMLAIGSDHGGFVLKQAMLEHLQQRGVEVKDFGVYSCESADYPDVAFAVAEAVAQGKYERGLLFCGTGVGVAIAANPAIMGKIISEVERLVFRTISRTRLRSS